MSKLRFLTGFLFSCILCITVLCPAQSPLAQTTVNADDHAAVIFVYNRIGEDQYPDTNIRKEQFENHVKELTDGTYNPVSLPALIESVKNGNTLPERTIAISFDGGHHSVLDHAAPLLLDNDIPFTVFVATDLIDRNSPQYMNWDDLRRLAKNKLVTIGLHPAAYMRLADENTETMARQINKARARYREELGSEATLFAYPFGEYSTAYRDFIEQQKFIAAFGQQSSVAYSESDIYALPRFSMTDSYGSLDRFRMTANALPLPLTDITPADPQLDTNAPSIGFTIEKDLTGSIDRLSCFASNQSRLTKEIVNDTRIELRLDRPFDSERVRINCTMPGPAGEEDEEPRWRWFGMLMTAPLLTPVQASTFQE